MSECVTPALIKAPECMSAFVDSPASVLCSAYDDACAPPPPSCFPSIHRFAAGAHFFDTVVRPCVRACVRVGTTLLSRVAVRALRPATRSCCTTARIMNAAPHHRLLHPLGCLGYWRDVRTRALTGCILKSVHVDVVLEYLAALSLSQATPPQYSWHANYTVRPNTPGPGVVLRGARQPRAATSTAGVRRAMLRLCTRPEAHGTGAAVVFVHELAAAARMSESKCVHQHSLSSRRTASKEPLWLQASPHRCFFFFFFLCSRLLSTTRCCI
jgi:hypothetical protein